jgi:hypothetical protein
VPFSHSCFPSHLDRNPRSRRLQHCDVPSTFSRIRHIFFARFPFTLRPVFARLQPGALVTAIGRSSAASRCGNPSCCDGFHRRVMFFPNDTRLA